MIILGNLCADEVDIRHLLQLADAGISLEVRQFQMNAVKTSSN